MENKKHEILCPHCNTTAHMVVEKGTVYCLGKSHDGCLSKCFHHLNEEESKAFIDYHKKNGLELPRPARYNNAGIYSPEKQEQERQRLKEYRRRKKAGLL